MHSLNGNRSYSNLKIAFWNNKIAHNHTTRNTRDALSMLLMEKHIDIICLSEVNILKEDEPGKVMISETGHGQLRPLHNKLLKFSFSRDENVETGHSQLKISAWFKNVNTGHSQLRHRASELCKISLWDQNIETGHSQLKHIPNKLSKFSFSRYGNVETGHSQLRTRVREVVKDKHQQRHRETAVLHQRKRDEDNEPGHSQRKKIASTGFSWELLLPFVGFLHFKYKHELLNMMKSSVVTSF